MKIIIIGAGFTGVQLARRLVSEKNDVVLIDKDEDTVRHLSSRIDCLVVLAKGNSLDMLQSAGIANADALIALTDSDEVNMITCSLVGSMYPNVIKIARVRNYDYYINSDAIKSNKQKNSQAYNNAYGIDYMIHPDVEAASSIVTAFEHGAVADVLEFSDSAYEMTNLEIEKNSALDGILVQEIRQLVSAKFLLPLVTSAGDMFLPKGTTRLSAGDVVSLLVKKDDLPQFLSLSGSNQHEIRRIILVGAGRIGTSIAEGILHKKKSDSFLSKIFDFRLKPKVDLRIIDKDSKLAKEAQARFPEAKVFNADITDESFIEEENLRNFDLVITATRNHELNMISSAYFKSLGCAKTICLVTSSAYVAIAKNIGIDVAIPIKDAVVDSILSHLRGKSVTGLHTLREGGFELVEYELPQDTKASNKALKDLTALTGRCLVLLVKKDGAYSIADGNTTLAGKDKVIVVLANGANGANSAKLLDEVFGG